MGKRKKKMAERCDNLTQRVEELLSSLSCAAYGPVGPVCGTQV
jgi:hypothetical protein